jgi:Ca2+-binding EF-hand superfamily protein
VEREEIKKCAEELGTQFTSDDELDKTMKLLDLNKDGKISLNEFNAWWYSKKSGTE